MNNLLVSITILLLLLSSNRMLSQKSTDSYLHAKENVLAINSDTLYKAFIDFDLHHDVVIVSKPINFNGLGCVYFDRNGVVRKFYSKYAEGGYSSEINYLYDSEIVCLLIKHEAYEGETISFRTYYDKNRDIIDTQGQSTEIDSITDLEALKTINRLDVEGLYNFDFVTKLKDRNITQIKSFPKIVFSEPEIGDTTLINAHNVILRTEASVKSEIISQLHVGSEVVVRGIHLTEGENKWFEVTILYGYSYNKESSETIWLKGENGYIFGAFMEPVEKGVI